MWYRIATPGALIAAVLLALPAPAQTLYRSVTPDGRVIYSDKPPPDAVKTEERKLDTGKVGVTAPSAREKSTLKELESSRKSREASSDRVRKAEIALHDAEVAQAMGKEPQAGERIGSVGGNQRLTDAYWERQKKLEDNVKAARANLDRARAAR
jgi:hypothetical protein